MELQQAIDELKFRLSGDLLESELGDEQFTKVINMSIRELQRYLDSTMVVTIPFQHCLDFNTLEVNNKKLKISSISRVYRAKSYVPTETDGSATADPMYLAQWQMLGGIGSLYNYQDYMYNYMAWNVALQTRNTTSTDLAFIYDKYSNKLYVNIASNYPDRITLEYIPKIESIEDIISDFWIDILMRLAAANMKIIVGRIRSKYTATGSLLTLDGTTILEEGKTELTSLRDFLEKNTNLLYPID